MAKITRTSGKIFVPVANIFGTRGNIFSGQGAKYFRTRANISLISCKHQQPSLNIQLLGFE